MDRLMSAGTLAIILALGCTGGPAPEGTMDRDSAAESGLATPIGNSGSTRSDGAASAADTSPACAGTIIDGSGVGAVRIGTTVVDLRRDCEVVGDTTLLLEGEAQPALIIDVDDVPVVAEIVDDRVWRVRVTGPGLATADSMRVGMPANRLGEYPGARVVAGEGVSVVVVPEHCGLSYVIGLPPAPGVGTAESLAALPDDVRIESILVFGCDTGTD
ncbi:MAG TPA: hypothetical protein VNZ57_16135 [Longimicrobiales bacterium]|nr:hypothetical protein [Longimicrobiales bacterium]